MRSPRPTDRSERLFVVGAISVTVLFSLIVNVGAIDNPPAWDSAITVSPAALAIVENDFNVWSVAQMPSSPEGGPGTHATSIYTIGLAIAIGVFGPSAAFIGAHIMSIVLVGGLAGATYLLGRERLEPAMAATVSVVVGVIPVVVQQAADIYLDLPLGIVTTLACWAAVRRRFVATSALVLLGIAVKTSGIFLLPLILLARPRARRAMSHVAYSVMAGLIAILPFVVVFVTTHRFSTGITPSMGLPLVRSSAALLILTIDVFAILAVYVLVVYGRLRGRSLDRVTVAGGVVVLGFFGVHLATMLFSGTIAILPRYYIVLLPVLLITIAPRQWPSGSQAAATQRAGVGFLVITLVFSIANVGGDLYPRPDDDFYVVAERSTRAQQLLQMQVAGTKDLVGLGLPILAERQVHFRLEYPGMGYVDERPENVTSVFIDYPETFPNRFAMLMERRFTNPLEQVEREALEQGYTLRYEDVVVGPYRSELIIAER